MFLSQIERSNPNLIKTAVEFHQAGKIPPSCFMIDLDTVAENTRTVAQAAQENGISLYFITKQVGFNPVFARTVCENGIEKTVAVDWNEALTMLQNNISLGHVGHLVQIPQKYLSQILSAAPEVITVFSVENAQRVSSAAREQGLQINVLVKIVDHDSFIYSGQEGGILFEDLEKSLDLINALPNIKVAGITSFPCTLFDPEQKEFIPTHNLKTLQKAAVILEKKYGGEHLQVNAPGNSCSNVFPLLSRFGATHAEPGNALTGTTPLHAISKQPELPALIHVSEISHHFESTDYCYGGGLYRRSSVTRAIVGNDPSHMREAKVITPQKTSIDYYVGLKPKDKKEFRTGDTVLWSSRAQIFVTRSSVAVVQGIRTNTPTLVGIYDPFGRSLNS